MAGRCALATGCCTAPSFIPGSQHPGDSNISPQGLAPPGHCQHSCLTHCPSLALSQG